MAFLTPLFLLLGLLGLPILLLYMLRLRRQEMQVSSTLLWQQLMRDREANAPWQKLRRNLLLLLQLLILAALVLALGRPYLAVPTVGGGSVVVLLDASASMQAVDVAPSRFLAARAEVERLIGELDGGSRMTLIKVGRVPEVLLAASGDRAALRQTLEEAAPEPAAADWRAAFALAAGAVQGFREARVVIVSDGGLPEELPPLPAETLYLPVGRSGENLALSALATRSTPEGPQLFAAVRNEGLIDRETLLSVEVDGLLFDSRRLQVPAGGSASTTWSLPEGAALIEARLGESQEDYLPLDDRAWAVHEGGAGSRTLLVGEGNFFLEQLFAVLPGIELFRAEPGSPLLEEPFDLYIFDGAPLPERPPAADMLIINPPAGGAPGLLEVSGTFSNTVAVRLADSPLLQFVDWRSVHIRRAAAVSAPWAEPLVVAEGGPLILAGERGGRRIAVLTFDVRDSDLPLQIAFPILMANITGWLNPGRAFDAPTGLQPGEPVAITPNATATAVLVRRPDGQVWQAQVGQEEIFFAGTEQLGLYQVSLRDGDGERPAGSFAVNLFNPAESRIRPAESILLGEEAVAAAAAGDAGRREVWAWLLAGAFLLLVVEWWVHHRGARLPQMKFR